MTKDNWIAIGIAAATQLITITLNVIGLWLSWKNTSRAIASALPKDQPAQNAGSTTLITKTVSANFAPLSMRYKRLVRIGSQIVNFIATYFLVQQALKTSPITRGEVIIIAACLWFTAITFIMPLIVGVYEYFEVILGISQPIKRT